MQTQPTNNPLTTAQPPESSHPATPPSSSPPLSPSGSPSPGPNRLPKGHRGKRRSRWLLAVLTLLAVGGIGAAGWYFYASRHTARPDLILHTVKKEKLQITITERGSLEAADNTFFSCKVKA